MRSERMHRTVSRFGLLSALLAITVLLAACAAPSPSAQPAEPSKPAETPQPAPEPAKPKIDYPTKPIRLIVTHSAGGTTDAVARVTATHAQRYLSQPLAVENMTGAGGAVARSYVWKADPDGYTLLASQMPSMDAGVIVNKNDFVPMDFTHVYNLSGRDYNVVAVQASSPIKNLAELAEASKQKTLSNSGSGIGGNGYIVAMMMQDMVGVNLTYVPFNSGSEAVTAVAGAQVDMGTGALESYLPLHESGHVRILAIFGPERDHRVPEIPTAIEQGYPGVVLDQLTGLFAPPNTPPEIVQIVAEAYEKAYASAEFKNSTLPFTPLPLGPAEFKAAHKELSDIVEGMRPLLEKN